MSQNTIIPIGSILCCTWGYGQTNIDYYEVVALCGKTMIKVRPIAKRATSDHGVAHYKVEPIPGSFIGESFRRKVKTYGSITGIEISSFQWGSVWSGDPQIETDARYGH